MKSIFFANAVIAEEAAEAAVNSPNEFMFWGSLVIFVLVIFFLMLRKFISPAVTVILGIFLSILFGFTDFKHAAEVIDLNLLFLVSSMMITTSILTESGFFEWFVIGMTKYLRGNAFLILFMMLVCSMVFSAFLDNVTVMILMIPIAIVIAKVLELPVRPILFFVLVATNLGGAATLLGGTQNMILGVQTEFTFNDFIIHAAPCVMGIGVVFILLATLILSNNLTAPPHIRTKVEDFYPRGAILNLRRMRSAFAIFVLMIIAFVFRKEIRIEPGTTAMLGMALMLAIYRPKTEQLLRYLNWEVIIMLVGFFILTGTLAKNGVIDVFGEMLVSYSSGNVFMLCMFILWGSALLSAFIDSIPLMLLLVPVYSNIASELQLNFTNGNPLLLAILFGVCLGGCGTLLGSPASMITYKMAEANGYPIPARRFFYWGFPSMVLQLGLCSLYIWFRYFFIR